MGWGIRHRGGRSGERSAAWFLGICCLAFLHASGCVSPPPATDAATRPANVIHDFGTIETPETVAVIVKSHQPLTYTAVRQENPPGVYFQFPDTLMEGREAAYFPPPNPVIRSIRTAGSAAGRDAHVFLELAQDTSYEIAPETEGLKIVFRKPSAVAAFGGMPTTSETKAPPLERPSDASPVETGPAKMAAAAPALAASVLQDVRAEIRPEAVLIRLTADGTLKAPNVFTLDHPARIVFDFMGLHSRFKGEQRIAVRSPWVTQIRHLGYPDKVRLVAETEARHLNSYSMKSIDNGLVIIVGVRNP